MQDHWYPSVSDPVSSLERRFLNSTWYQEPRSASDSFRRPNPSPAPLTPWPRSHPPHDLLCPRVLEHAPFPRVFFHKRTPVAHLFRATSTCALFSASPVSAPLGPSFCPINTSPYHLRPACLLPPSPPPRPLVPLAPNSPCHLRQV
jgi:hypothetical protein